MTRHSKKKKITSMNYSNNPIVTIDLEDSDDEPAPSPPPITPAMHKERKKLKQKIPKQPKATLDSLDDSSQDELAVEQQLIQQSARVKSSPAAAKERKLTEALEKAAKVLSALGDPAEMKRLLQRAASRNDDSSNKIKKLSDEILALLPSSISAPAQQSHGQVPSTINLYDQYFTHHGPGKRMYVLKPIEVFQGNHNLTRKKVAGFIQHKGTSFPLKYALPGWIPCSDDHHMLLDGELWTDEVQRWGSFHNHHFKSHPFDVYHGKPNGASCASHVEPRLMLWYACDRLRELQGVDRPIQFMLGSLFRLRDFDIKMEAEIFLTRPPCKKCLEIKDLIEEYTKIKFFFKTAQHLGELHAEKDKHGWMGFGRYAQVSDGDDSEDDEPKILERQETVEKTRSTFAVVIRGLPNTPQKTSKPNRQELTPPSTQSSTFTKTSSMTQKSRIQSFSYQPNRRSFATAGSHQAEVESDSDASDYQPRTNMSRRSKSTSSLFETPDQAADTLASAASSAGPFGVEARRQAKLLKRERKRRAEENASPSLRKKVRHMKL